MWAVGIHFQTLEQLLNRAVGTYSIEPKLEKKDNVIYKKKNP